MRPLSLAKNHCLLFPLIVCVESGFNVVTQTAFGLKWHNVHLVHDVHLLHDVLEVALNTGADGDCCSFHRYTAINAVFALIMVELHNDDKHI